MADVQNWVFDLDDTLYAERDYVCSALNFIGAKVAGLYGSDEFAVLLHSLYDQAHPDPIGIAWARCALPAEGRAPMIIAMNEHMPTITLSIGAQAMLAHLRQRRRAYAIVTDGRSTTQRAKIAALGCVDAAFVSISEEVGLSKLDSARFAAVATALPPGQCCYVGDNPSKDFIAPRQLGWKTVMLDHRGKGIHAQRIHNDSAYHPDQIVLDLRELLREL